MCGICGYICCDGNSFHNGYLGICKLLNRGYDSVGVTTINNNMFVTHKHASDDKELADVKILKYQKEHIGDISIFHSRWRTVGEKTDANSHPHNDMSNQFSLVHNGIIDNYKEIKQFLIAENFTFKSETDTEVIVNLIYYFYKQGNNVITSIEKSLKKLEGTYALCILCVNTPDIIYCVCNNIPLLIGIPKNLKFAMIVSECRAFEPTIEECYVLNNLKIATIDKKNIGTDLVPEKVTKLENFVPQIETHSPSPFEHWTLKEIYDQVNSCYDAINIGERICADHHVDIKELDKHAKNILSCENLLFLGCGSSYHAGLVISRICKNVCNFNIIVMDGSEFTVNDIPKTKTCAILISQSGETKDLHRCLEICNKNNILSIGIINVVNSLIARGVTCNVYLNCGREFAVASTKAFSSQIVVLTLVSIWLAQNTNVRYTERKNYTKKLLSLSEDIQKTINKNNCECKKIADYLWTKNSVFVLGKNSMEFIAKEGALKLKEIGYIHAEGYSSSALKHGPYALLDKGFPVILLIPNDENYIRNKGIIDELLSRKSYVIGITNNDTKIDGLNNQLIVPNESYLEITFCIVLQLIAYYLAIKKGINPDFPRNLSKTVSVD